MATNRYLEEFKARVEAQGGVVLEPEWLSSGKKHHVRCARGHDCYPRPKGVQEGKGICFACRGATKSAPAEAAFKAEVQAQGGVVLEPEWLGVNKPHHVLCARQHHSHPTPGNVLAGHGICRKCSYRDRNAASKRSSEKAFEANVRAQGGTVLESEYRGAYTRHLVRCAQGHDCYPTPNKVQSGRGICAECSGQDPAAAWRNFKASLDDLGATLLETEWRGALTKHHVICAEGHDCWPTPSRVQQGGGICITCAGQDPAVAQAAFTASLAEAGAELLDTGRRPAGVPRHVRCAQGHDCWPSPNSIQSGKGICFTCSWADQDVFYVVTGPLALGLKFGVTSGDPRQRLGDHRRDGYTEVARLFTKLPRMAAGELEQQVLRLALREAGFRPVRGQEYFGIGALSLVLRLVDKFADEHGLNLSAFRKAA